jgi:hypothetical protein
MPTTVAHSPSVPISLYREVMTELQTAQGMLKTLQTDNQQLMQQNQQLRLEIERVVQSSLRLRQVADGYQNESAIAPIDATLTNLEAIFDLPSATIIQSSPRQKAAKPKANPLPEPSVEKRLTEQEPQLRHSAPPDKSSEISAWWLALVICTIIVTAFGTGFLIVRPLLPPR